MRAVACGIERRLGDRRCACARGRRSGRRHLQEIAAIEAERGRLGVVEGRFVLAQVLVGELEIHLEEDRHEVVAAQTTRLAPGAQRSNRGELVAAKGLTGSRDDRDGFIYSGLRQRRRWRGRRRRRRRLGCRNHGPRAQ
jgi:hypothetical protein